MPDSENVMLWIWLAITVISVIVEISTVEMVSIWFTIGGLMATVATLIGAPYWAQIIIFVVISVTCLVFFRKISIKWILRHVTERTNVESFISEHVKLLTDVTEDNPGTAQINDVVWSVVGKDGFSATAGQKVKIVDIKGNKLVVTSADDE